MTFSEAVAAMKAGHSVRRECWSNQHINACTSSDCIIDASSHKACQGIKDFEATDWRRCDGLDRDAADAVIDVAHELWRLSETIQNAMDSPGVLKTVTIGHLTQAAVRIIVAECEGLSLVNLNCIAVGRFMVDVKWAGDGPRSGVQKLETGN